MVKIYYNTEGWVCDTPWLSVPKTYDCKCIEITEEEFSKTLWRIPHHAWKVVNGELSLERYEDDDNVERWTKEVRELEEWFELYDRQVNEYNRCVRLGIPYNCKHGTIDELDEQAYSNSKRLRELRILLE